MASDGSGKWAQPGAPLAVARARGFACLQGDAAGRRRGPEGAEAAPGLRGTQGRGRAQDVVWCPFRGFVVLLCRPPHAPRALVGAQAQLPHLSLAPGKAEPRSLLQCFTLLNNSSGFV